VTDQTLAEAITSGLRALETHCPDEWRAIRRCFERTLVMAQDVEHGYCLPTDAGRARLGSMLRDVRRVLTGE